jgi:hypothetical protein
MSYRYGIDGERIEQDELEVDTTPHPSTCDRGWIPVDGDVAMVRPCPRCRPETVQRLHERKAGQ